MATKKKSLQPQESHASSETRSRLLSPLLKPSKAQRTAITRHFAVGRLADLPELLQVFLAMSGCVEEFMGAADFANNPVTSSPHSFGLFSGDDTELNVSAVLHADLLRALWSMDQFFVVDSPCPGLWKHKKDLIYLQCLHQFKLKEPSSQCVIDIVIGQNISVNGSACVLPRIAIEASIDSTKTKENQLFAYVNNLSRYWPAGFQFLVIGAVVVLSGFTPCVSTYGFYQVFDPDSNSFKIAHVLLHQGIWCSETIGRLFAALKCLCKIPLWKLKMDNATGRGIPQTNSGANVVISEDGSIVTKVYDYRSRAHGRIHDDSRRRFLLSIEYLNAKIVGQSPCSMLHVIQYPCIVGTHVPTRVAHIVSLMHTLVELHKKDLVFADLRLSNVVFKDDFSCRLIDFDWTGIHGINVYPSRFNADIHDGVRHPEAVSDHTLLKHHDMFALGGMMKLFETTTPAKMVDWTEAIRLLVVDNDLQAAISHLSNEDVQKTELRPWSHKNLSAAQIYCCLDGIIREAVTGGEKVENMFMNSPSASTQFYRQPRCPPSTQRRLERRDSLLALSLHSANPADNNESSFLRNDVPKQQVNDINYESGKRQRSIKNGADSPANKRRHVLQEASVPARDGGSGERSRLLPPHSAQ